MKVLVTGGTGTLGSHLLPLLLQDKLVERIRVLSRDEHKQQELAAKLNSPKIDWFIGDICNRDRVMAAARDVDLVYHLAAMKTVDGCEYQPLVAIQTNILGTSNVAYACNEQGVQRAIFVSSDKAVAPLNLYGCTKATAEKLWIQSNVGSRCSFSACRYGNVLGSTGSVIYKWIKEAHEKGTISVTNEGHDRFWWVPRVAAEFVRDCMDYTFGGEIFIPNMKSAPNYRLVHAFQIVAEEKLGFAPEKVDIPERGGEKDSEILFSIDENPYVTKHNGMYIRWPSHDLYPVRKRGSVNGIGILDSAVCDRLTTEEMADMIREVWPQDNLLARVEEQIHQIFGQGESDETRSEGTTREEG